MTFHSMLPTSLPRLSRALATASIVACATACTVGERSATEGDSADDASTTDAAPDGDTRPSPPTDETTTTGETTIEAATIEATTVESSTTEAVDPGDPCACIDPDATGSSNSCTCARNPCGRIDAGCAGEADADGDPENGSACGAGATFTVPDEAALDCALDLLISGQPGYIEYYFSPDQGLSGNGAFVGVRPGREGLMQTWKDDDLINLWSGAGVVPLKDAAYFEGCKAEAVLEARYWCTVAWSTEEPPAQCMEPGESQGA